MLQGVEAFLLEEVLLVNSFSCSGAAQFARDCDAVLSVFRPFAPRCDRHAKARDAGLQRTFGVRLWSAAALKQEDPFALRRRCVCLSCPSLAAAEGGVRAAGPRPRVGRAAGAMPCAAGGRGGAVFAPGAFPFLAGYFLPGQCR